MAAGLAAEACARRVAFIRSRICCAPGRPSRLSMPDMGAGAGSSHAVMAMIERPVLDISRSISNSCGVQGRVSFWRGMKPSCYSNGLNETLRSRNDLHNPQPAVGLAPPSRPALVDGQPEWRATEIKGGREAFDQTTSGCNSLEQPERERGLR